MTDLEKEILHEIVALPKENHATVLAFVRYLKFEELAKQHKIDNDELLRMCMEEIIKHPYEDFRKALEYALEKNRAKK